MIRQATKRHVRVGRFRPFTSRPEGVISVVHTLKQSLARWKTLAYDPSQRRLTPGEWLPEHKSWFVEEIIWPAVRC